MTDDRPVGADPENGDQERLLTPGEVARHFRVGPKTVTRWCATERITGIRTPGGHWRIPESELNHRGGLSRPAQPAGRTSR